MEAGSDRAAQQDAPTPPPSDRRATPPARRSSADSALAGNGPVAAALQQFEVRPQQLDMAARVGDAFSRGHHLLIEAGTGVGKSFAYLVPAIETVTSRGGCVVISTHTIALQEQLIHKDIPFLKKALDKEFRAELVIGRSNYLGLRRLARTSQRQEMLLSDGDRQRLWEVEDWAYQTSIGSLSDMVQQPPPGMWEMIRSDRNDCMGRRCSHYERCFYQRARRRAADAQLLVVNHALLFADLAVREQGAAILPEYGYLILDEAHTVEDVASGHFGLSVADAQLGYLYNSLFNERTGRGVLANLAGRDALAALTEARRQTNQYFIELNEFAGDRPNWNGRLAEPPPIEQRVSHALENLQDALDSLRGQSVEEQTRFELAGKIEHCAAYASQLDTLHGQKEDGLVYWLEAADERSGARRRPTSLHGGPVNVGEMLQEVLFEPKRSVVMTSATLTTAADDPFAYMRDRLGLTDEPAAALGSPFDYRRQVTVYLEPNMPEPSSPRFTDEAAERMKPYLRESQGRAFVLFTSYGMMNRCARLLEDFCEDEGLTLLVQGQDLSRSQMLDTFRDTPRCVLFGTASFWAGVDVRGAALSNVIITKLPFAVPTHPMLEARLERIRARGRNPFMEYQVPEAVLKFKQGFGRLIRSKTDRGMVVILDPRVRTKPYGKRFLEALPDCRVVDGLGV